MSGKARVAAAGQDFGVDRRARRRRSSQTRGRSTCRPHASLVARRPRPIARWRSAPRPAEGRLPARVIRARRGRAGNARQGHEHPPCPQHPAGDRARRKPAGGRGHHARRPLVELSARTSTTGTTCRTRSLLEETYYHRLNPPSRLCLAAGLYGRPLPRRDAGGERRRRGAGAEGLPPGRRAARLRALLSQRDGRADAAMEVHHGAPSMRS